MGSFGGHILPGSFFIIFGLWHSFMLTLRYVASSRRQQRPGKHNKSGYRSSTTMPCICVPFCKNNSTVESWVKLFFVSAGIASELITGIKTDKYGVPGQAWFETGSGSSNNNNNVTTTTMAMEHHHDHSAHNMNHKRDASVMTMAGVSHGFAHVPFMPHGYYFGYNNIQHCTMYSMFAIGSVVEILMARGWRFPLKTEFVLAIWGFVVEAFIFAFHLHAREPMDVHLHSLLVYSIVGCAVFACLETWQDRQIIFSLGRCMFVILQGTWFWQVAFVLFPPFNGPLGSLTAPWDLYDHGQIMVITMSYIWHIMTILCWLLVQYVIVDKYLAKFSGRYMDYELYDVVVVGDVEERSLIGKRPKICIDSDDEYRDDNNEEVQFDTTRLNKGSPASSTSSSGHGSGKSGSLFS